ncbi:MAG: hypothetical protein ABIG95_01850 [Candidatus Woesearchaeota archaeon]
MGHTVWSQRMIVDVMLDELKNYGRSLRQPERELYESLLKKSLKHLGNISFASSIHVWAFVLLSILLEQEKRIIELEELYESLANGCVQEQEFACALAKNT